MLEHAAFGPAHIGIGHALQRQRQGLDDKIVDREFVRRLAVFVLRRDAVDLLARLQKIADVAVNRQVKMRDGLHRCGEPRGDRAAHPVMRHDLVTAFLIKRTNLLIGHGRRDHRRGTSRGCSGRRTQTLTFARYRHIAGDDAAMRSRALDAADVEARFFR